MITDIKLVVVGGEMHKTGEIFDTFENMRFKKMWFLQAGFQPMNCMIFLVLLWH